MSSPRPFSPSRPSSLALPPSLVLSADARAHRDAMRFAAAGLDRQRAAITPHVTGWAMSGRTIGVEIEGYLASGGPLATQQRRVRDVLQLAGLAVCPAREEDSRRPRALPAWDVGEDISVYDDARRAKMGLEIRSPVLHGEGALDEIRAMLYAIREIGFLSNNSCAFHVHVGVPNPSLAECKAFAHAALAQEDALDQLVIPERRGNERVYTKRLGAMQTSKEPRPRDDASLLHQAIDRVPTEEMLGAVVTPDRKFHKWTLSHLVTHGTIENRVRDAYATDPESLIDWVRLTDRLVDTGLRGEMVLPAAAAMWTVDTTAHHVTSAPDRERITVSTLSPTTPAPINLTLERELAQADFVTWALGRPLDTDRATFDAAADAYLASLPLAPAARVVAAEPVVRAVGVPTPSAEASARAVVCATTGGSRGR